MTKACPIAVLISGNGSNLQALIDASAQFGYRIVGVISNNPDAFGLQRAEQAGIPGIVINHRDFTDRVSFDHALAERLETLQPSLIVLAGFMRILSDEFVMRFADRVLNIHPSLLPKYPGTNTHQRVLEAGDREHGVSVHFVTEKLDGGPVIAQSSIPVLPDDTVETLKERIHVEEHRIYPQVVAMFASGRLRMHEGKAWLDGKVLPPTGLLLE